MRINLTDLMRPVELMLVTKYHVSHEGIKSINQKVMSFVGEQIVPMFQQGIEAVYDRNHERVPGSLPIDAVKNSITYELDINNMWVLEIFWDDSLIQHWQTDRGDNIYMYRARGREEDKVVRSFKQHWRAPIDGMSEEGYILQQISPDVSEFLDSEELKIMIRRTVAPFCRR